MNTEREALPQDTEYIDITPLYMVRSVQAIREAKSLDDAMRVINGLAANGWLTHWNDAKHPDGTSYKDLPHWQAIEPPSTAALQKRIEELEANFEQAIVIAKRYAGSINLEKKAENAIRSLKAGDVQAPKGWKLTDREIELIDGMIEVQQRHANQCDSIANRIMAEKQKTWDLERIALLEKIKIAAAPTDTEGR